MTLKPNPLLPEGVVDFLDDLLLEQRADLCTISRPSTTRSPGGAPVKGFEEVESDVPCQIRYSKNAASENVLGGALGVTNSVEIDFDRDETIENGWQIEGNGQKFDVVSVPKGQTYGLVLTVQAVLSQG